MIHRSVLLGSAIQVMMLTGCNLGTRSTIPASANHLSTVAQDAQGGQLSEPRYNNEPKVPILQMDEVQADSEPTVPKLEIEDITANSRDDPFARVASGRDSSSLPYTSENKETVTARKGSSNYTVMDLDKIAIEIANNIVRFKTTAAGRRLRITGYIAAISFDESGGILVGIFSEYKSLAIFYFSKDFESKVATLNKGTTVTLDGFYQRTEKIDDRDVPVFEGAEVVSSSPDRYVSPETRLASAWMELMQSMLKGAAESQNR